MVHLDLHNTSPQPPHALDTGDDDVVRLLDLHAARLRAYLRLLAGQRRRESPSGALHTIVRGLLRQPGAPPPGSARFVPWLYTGVAAAAAAWPNSCAEPIEEPPAEVTELYTRIQAQCGLPADHAPRLEAAFDRLGRRQAEIVALVRIADVPHRVVAEWFGSTVVAVRSELGSALVCLGETPAM